MTTLPAECTRCGHRWQPAFNGIVIEGAANVSIGQSDQVCPECGGPARGLSGSFNVADGGIEILSGPEWSWDLVAALRLGLRRIEQQKPANVDAAVAEVDPNLGAQFSQVTSGWSRGDKMGLISILLGLVLADYSNIISLTTAVEHAFRWYLEHGPHGLR